MIGLEELVQVVSSKLLSEIEIPITLAYISSAVGLGETMAISSLLLAEVNEEDVPCEESLSWLSDVVGETSVSVAAELMIVRGDDCWLDRFS